jgi:FkbM family methyltransferase
MHARYGVYDAGQYSLKYRSDSYDRVIIEEVWKSDEYYLNRVDIDSDSSIIDIGAHIGAFAIKAQSLFHDIPIIAVEPVRENFRLLEHNLERNRCTAVTALNAAVMSESGAVRVYLDPKNTAGHSTVARVSGTTVSALAIRLADIFRTYGLTRVGLLKIDCEGAEYQIILSADNSIWKRVSSLVFEYHPIEGQDFGRVREFLEAQGFAMTARKDGYFCGQGTALFQKVEQKPVSVTSEE